MQETSKHDALSGLSVIILAMKCKDRNKWLEWLFEAKKRYGATIFNYMAASNPIHLLIDDKDGGEVISKSIQPAAGRTAQEYNQREGRKGAYC